MKVFFTINEAGEVENIKVHSPYPVLNEELKRVFRLTPHMLPGLQQRKPVKVRFGLPVMFKARKVKK